MSWGHDGMRTVEIFIVSVRDSTLLKKFLNLKKYYSRPTILNPSIHIYFGASEPYNMLVSIILLRT